MKRFIILFPFIFFSVVLNAQLHDTRDGTGFKSVFQDFGKGDFSGTLNGTLLLKKNDGDQPQVFRFKEDKASLNLKHDPDTVYDVSRKNYLCKKNEIQLRYTTYCLANCFEIILDGDTCSYDVIDGGCDLVIGGLEWSYSADKEKERLYLTVTKDFGLWKRRTRVHSYIVQAGSKLCFEINRRK